MPGPAPAIDPVSYHSAIITTSATLFYGRLHGLHGPTHGLRDREVKQALEIHDPGAGPPPLVIEYRRLFRDARLHLLAHFRGDVGAQPGAWG